MAHQYSDALRSLVPKAKLLALKHKLLLKQVAQNHRQALAKQTQVPLVKQMLNLLAQKHKRNLAQKLSKNLAASQNLPASKLAVLFKIKAGCFI